MADGAIGNPAPLLGPGGKGVRRLEEQLLAALEMPTVSREIVQERACRQALLETALCLRPRILRAVGGLEASGSVESRERTIQRRREVFGGHGLREPDGSRLLTRPESSHRLRDPANARQKREDELFFGEGNRHGERNRVGRTEDRHLAL